MIDEGQQAATLLAGDPVDIAYTLLSATNSLLPYSLSTTELGKRAELGARAKKTAELLKRGLSS